MSTPRAQYDNSISFLQQWRPEGPWTLTAITPDKKKITTSSFTDVAKMDRWVRNHGAKRNVYFTVNPLLRMVNKKPERADVESMAWLHVDVDPRPGEDLADEQARALDMLRKPPDGVPPPTVIVFSGGGYQGFWKLRAPMIVNGDESKYSDAALYNKQLEMIFGADHCHNVDRIMRLPGTINRPDEKKRDKGRTEALAAVIEWHEDRVYDIDQFEMAQKVQSSVDKDGFSGNMIRISGNIPRIANVDTDLPKSLPDLCKVVIVQGHDPDNPQKWASRSEALFYVVCELIRHDVNDDTIYAIITDPDFAISESVLEKGNSSDRYAIHQIERGREQAIDPNLMELNGKHAVISSIGGKCRIISEERDDVMNRSRIAYQSFPDFHNRYSHRKVTFINSNGNPAEKPLGKWWTDHPQRRQYDSIVFSPGGDIDGCYNLWRGFAYPARPGSCDLYIQHVRDNICAGDETLFRYVMGWMATTVQHPDQPGHTAIVMRGKQGTGKGVFVKGFGNLFGRHFMQISDSKHLTGNFNAHLEDCVVLFADEAFYAGDKKHESTLKTLVTEETMAIEKKGVDTGQGANFLHIFMASNSDWVVPADMNDRRFFVVDVESAKMQDGAYFKAIIDQLDNGGYEALLHMLMNLDISDFDVRQMPKTKALREQKMLNFSPEQEWWYNKLLDGRIFETEDAWPRYAFAQSLSFDFTSYAKLWSQSARSNNTRLGRFLATMVPAGHKMRAQLSGKQEIVTEDGSVQTVSRPRVYLLPTLDVCRKIFDDECGGPYDWTDPHLIQRDGGKADSPF